MYNAYKDRAQFLFVYIREAHPTDEWQMEENQKEGVVFAQPKSTDERKGVAEKCSASLKLSMPVVVDAIDNRVDNLYAGWPERLFVVDKSGKIALAGRQGPWGFKPEEVRAWLEENAGN
jgi:hypothetical protein